MTRNQTMALVVAGALAIDGACAAAAVAQKSTQAPPPSASKLSGSQVEGDPNGAVRALGSADDSGTAKAPPVTVPRLGGERDAPTKGTPPGTVR